jgi:hypothetical protein
MSQLLNTYVGALESRVQELARLTAEGKTIVCSQVVLKDVESLVRRYKIELRRVNKARRDAMPGFLRDVEETQL